jgi:beta-glucosidase
MMKIRRNLRQYGLHFGFLLVLTVLVIGSVNPIHSAYTYPFQDPTQPLETRVNNLLSLLTQAEKISLLHQYEPAISRLGIASFRTGTEALHGIAWLGNATVFPQPIGLGATFDPDLVKQIGSAVGDEARGYHSQNPAGNGLNLWAPVVDLERDPRAGRFEEGYGEDPYLVGQMAIAYCNGIKGDNSFYYKAIPTLKHFYAYNQEANRDTVSVNIDDRNKYEYYLKPFQYAIQSGAAKSLMTSYNKVNNVPCTVSPEIMSSVWGKWLTGTSDFFVVTDAYGPNNLAGSQGYYSNMVQACAGMIKAGVCSMTQDDNNPTNTINNITSALNQGLITTADIDNRVREILRVRFHTGEFDPAGFDPYAGLGSSEICASDHATLSGKAARESVVLLKNSNNILPLSKSSSVAVIGTMANTVYTDFYSGTLPYKVTPLAGIRSKVPSATYTADNTNNAAVNAAKAANVAIVFVGNDPLCGAGWAQSLYPSMGKEAVDRQVITLESSQESLIEAVYAANSNTILVLVSSFPYAITWPNTNLPGIIYTCHSGQEIGNAISDVLFGDYNPAGRLTATWYSSTSQIPAITNYDIITGKRTYMYFSDTPLYPFGYGLSYTSFQYSNLRLSSASITDTSQVTVSVDVKNTGTRAGDEVVQLYVKDVTASVTRPIKELKGFKRIINLAAAGTQTVSFTLPASELAYWSTSKNAFYVEPGDFSIMVGKSSADIQLTTTLTVTGGGTITPTPTMVPTPTPIRTATPRRTAAPTRTATPRRSATPRITATPIRTPSPVTTTPPAVTATPTPTKTISPVPTETPVVTVTPLQTATPVPTTGGIKVQFYNQSTAATTNQVYLNVKLLNTGSSALALSNVKIRYYYTVDGAKPQNFYCDYAPVGSSNVTGTFVTMGTAKTGADTYVELGFTNGAGSLAVGGNTTIQGRFAKNDWTNYTQTNDYSFNSSATTFVDWNKATGYVSGALQWGVEP